VISRALADEESVLDLLQLAGFMNDSQNWRFGQLSAEAVRNLRKTSAHKFIADLGRLLGGRSPDSVVWQIVWRLRGWSGMPVIRNNLIYDIPRPWTRSHVAEWLLSTGAVLCKCDKPHHEAAAVAAGALTDEEPRLHSEEALDEIITKFVQVRGVASPFELTINHRCC
jgi:hypothetical protein